jgi:glycine/D-amino acid oxidase-like deaminating enzyme
MTPCTPSRWRLKRWAEAMRFDVIIVGAGIGGAVTALALGSRGWIARCPLHAGHRGFDRVGEAAASGMAAGRRPIPTSTGV